MIHTITVPFTVELHVFILRHGGSGVVFVVGCLLCWARWEERSLVLLVRCFPTNHSPDKKSLEVAMPPSLEMELKELK